MDFVKVNINVRAVRRLDIIFVWKTLRQIGTWAKKWKNQILKRKNSIPSTKTSPTTTPPQTTKIPSRTNKLKSRIKSSANTMKYAFLQFRAPKSGTKTKTPNWTNKTSGSTSNTTVWHSQMSTSPKATKSSTMANPSSIFSFIQAHSLRRRTRLLLGPVHWHHLARKLILQTQLCRPVHGKVQKRFSPHQRFW